MNVGDCDQDYDAAVQAVVDAAPPLTDAQLDKLATLLDDQSDQMETMVSICADALLGDLQGVA